MFFAGQALSEPIIDTNYNSYGYPGLIDMPGAHSRPDAELALSVSHFKNTTRTTLTFQMTPRLSGSFRYSNLYNIRKTVSGTPQEFIFDRSFSLHYRFVDETRTMPAIAVGLNDFFGTGIYESEYLVATKTIRPNFRVTGGIGWGRLGGINSFSNPLGVFGDRWDVRPGREGAQGGTVQSQNWFRGEAALFGGVQWQASDKLLLTAEYSSDAYLREDGVSFDRKSPFNFGLSYKLRPHTRLSANYLYGSEFGVQFSMALNPKAPPASAGNDKAPPPVKVRARRTAAQLGWSTEPNVKTSLTTQVDAALKNLGLDLQGFSISDTSVRVVFGGATDITASQSIGRISRALTGILPASVETFIIVPAVNGIAISQVTVRRSDLERFEYAFDGSWDMFGATQIDPARGYTAPIEGRYPRFKPELRPYLATAWFDPDQPLRLDLGIEARARYEPAAGVVFLGAVRKKIVGNLDNSTRVSDSVLPHVRSDTNIYDREGDPAITELTGAYYGRLGENLFGRVTFGYLERMFGGLSAEVLWKPQNSRFGLGAEINYVRQRDFDQLFGFQDYQIATGHVTGYWNVGKGLHTQVDLGRYLAGDWGATVSLERRFKNGWRVGAFATLTDVSTAEFGEGSFDKGIQITIPLSWISGRPNRQKFQTTIRPVTRDGGAKLDVTGRLYETVRGYQKAGLRDSWGRFWR